MQNFTKETKRDNVSIVMLPALKKGLKIKNDELKYGWTGERTELELREGLARMEEYSDVANGGNQEAESLECGWAGRSWGGF